MVRASAILSDIDPASSVVSKKSVRGVASMELGQAAVSFPIAATLYNAVLAVANAAGIPQSFGTVSATEILILGCLSVYAICSNMLDLVPSGLLALGVVVSFYVTCASGSVSADAARDLAIIGLFMSLGSRLSSRQLATLFRVITFLVVSVLVLELFDTDLYARIFSPASYYANTRGIEEFSLDDSGLFRNSLGFQGRFSFGLASHRTASLFIEQVSLANYAGVLCIYILSRYENLALLDRILCTGTVLLILVTNDSRTSTFLAVISFIGYYVYPKLDRLWCFTIMPAVLAAACGEYLFNGSGLITGPPTGDDLPGRIATTMRALASFDTGAVFGFGARQAPMFMDSGYAFIIVSSTIFGLLLFWLFLSNIITVETAGARRCLFALNMYFFTNMLIGGTAIFSIKVAAPLWTLVGFVANRRLPRCERLAQPSPAQLSDSIPDHSPGA